MITALFFAFSPFSVSGNGEAESVKESVFTLPALLEKIEDEAFEGTAAKTVILPGELEEIGERTFAQSRTLKTIQIPESVIFIGEHAFEGVSNLTIQGIEGSYAARWAREHKFSFVQNETSLSQIEKVGKVLKNSAFALLMLSCVNPDTSLWRRRRTEILEKSMRPQDRPELYPIDYVFP